MTTPRFTRFATALLTCAALSCGGSSRPTSPDATSGTIVISGARPLIEGETVTLTATLQSPTGTTTDVSASVTWSTDTPTVVTVSPRGVVTAVGSGDGRIRATLQAISGAATIAVGAASRSLLGRVHESAPTEQVAVAGATVVVIDSAGTTHSLVSDTGGNFNVSLQPGAAQITISADGYETSTVTIDVNANAAPLSLALVPRLREVRFQFPAEAPRPGYFVEERTFHVDMHHAGELRAAVTGESVSHGDAEEFCLELRDMANRVLDQTCGGFDVLPMPISRNLSIGAYEVKVRLANAFLALVAGPYWSATTLSGEIKHPS